MAGVALLSSSVSPGLAREYYYFHKSGVTREQFIADREECERLSGGVRHIDPGTIHVYQRNSLSAGQNALATGIASLFAGMVGSGQDRRTMSMVERTCMADKEYQRYRVEKAVVTDIDKLPSDEEKLDRHFSMAGAAEPIGERIVE